MRAEQVKWKAGVGGEDEDQLRQAFVEWLTANGARYPKIDWPSSETESGIRGGVAKEAIASGEHMIEIPVHLMMTPVAALNDPVVGRILSSVTEMIYGDLLLCVYIMHEMRKGVDSFYYPFLKILPEPGNISEWSNDDLLLLQDSQILLRARNRRQVMKNMYSKSVGMMTKLFPFDFSEQEFPYHNFKFAWNSLQARAFGKRLPWTAMVPFADCLNHSNVQTKYDYDVEGNGLFRLFPSGVNHYPAGAEVFNSYGRRPNDNLLMDYGFALLGNLWDEIDICLTLPDFDPNFQMRYNALFLIGSHTSRTFRIVDGEIPFHALTFIRVITMEPAVLQGVLDAVQRQASTPLIIDTPPAPPPTSPTTHSASPISPPAPAPTSDSPSSDESVSTDESVYALASLAPTMAAASITPNTKKVVSIKERYSQRNEAILHFERVYSAASELRALTMMRGLLLSILGSHATGIAQDYEMLSILERLRLHDTPAKADTDCTLEPSEVARLQAMSPESDLYWKHVTAINYRLTRKLIMARGAQLMDQLIAYFEECVVEGSEREESYRQLWQKLVTVPIDIKTEEEDKTEVDDDAKEIDDGGRPPSRGYAVRLKAYVRDATVPTQRHL